MVRIVELNNVDLYGRRFNGYNLTSYIRKNYSKDFSIVQLVNHKLSKRCFSKKIFSLGMEHYDYFIENLESEILGVKNQVSISSSALLYNKYFKEADILHFHMYHNMNLPISFLSQIDASKKIIIELHDTYWLTDSKIPMLEVFGFTNRNADSLNKQRKEVLNSIDATFIVHSPYMLDLFNKSDSTKNLSSSVRLINFGIDTNIFRPLDCSKKIRKKLHIPLDNIVLFCRAQEEFKGIDYIDRALSTTSRKNISVITVNRKGLLKSASKKIQVIDLGMVPNEKRMAELYNSCDIFLSPSTEESFGFMAVEAMACGKPVIVFDGTALPCTVNAPKVGISVPRDANKLRDAIEMLASNPGERTARGKAGLNFVKDTYSLKSYYSEYISLFKTLSQKKERKAQSIAIERCDNEYNFLDRTIPAFEHGSLSGITKINKKIDYSNYFTQCYISKFNSYLYKKLRKKEVFKLPLTLVKKMFPNSIKSFIRGLLKGGKK